MNRINVLDHGYVELMEVMGTDTTPAESARVSYSKGTKTVNDDRALIRYLMRHKHTSPLEMVEFKFRLKMPIFVARQHIRHRTANVNEVSYRYSVVEEEFYLPTELHRQSTQNKQCSAEELAGVDDTQENMLSWMDESADNSFDTYHALLDNNVSREIARTVLPLSIYTTMIWKIDMHNLFHYLKLRLHSHAQYEIQVYAQAMYDLIKPSFPICCEAFEDYSLYAKTFSRKEMNLLHEMLYDHYSTDIVKIWLEEDGSLSKREQDEFIDKLVGVIL